MTYMQHIETAANAVRTLIDGDIDLFLVAGSGFRDAISSLSFSQQRTFGMSEIPFFPQPAVAGHGSQLIFGQWRDRRVLIATGRVHLYEGRSLEEIVFAIHMAAYLNAKAVVLTNAAGSVTRKLPAGTLAVIKDQLNLTGQNSGAIRPRGDGSITFTDMTHCYDREWRARVAKRCQLPEGVYAGLTGPTYETAAEAHMLAVLGAHTVGMSTVQECIAARINGMKVLGFSLVTNMAGGLGGAIDHGDVLSLAKNHSPKLAEALQAAIEEA